VARIQRANSRQALLDAAFEEFSAKGYEAATVAGIAARAGVTTGALYAHFDGKLDLLVEAIGVRSTHEFVRTAAEIAVRPWSEAAPLIAREMGAVPDRRGLLLLDVVVAARRDPGLAAALRRQLEAYLRAMNDVTGAGRATGAVDPALGLDDLARVFGLLSLGMLVFAALGEAPPSAGAFERLVDLLLQSEVGPAAHPAEPEDEAPPAVLARVRGRAATVERDRRRLHDAIAEAVAEGHSLRRVGAAAGLSHEAVRRLLQDRPPPP
jgi:AcrR family transcriptional regulator